MKKDIKHVGISFVTAFLSFLILVFSQVGFIFANQLQNSDISIPFACFKVLTNAGMKNTNESVTFGSNSNFNSSTLSPSFNFDSRCTTDSKYKLQDLSLTWDFGDSKSGPYIASKTNSGISHTYLTAGNYTVTLIAKNKDGGVSNYKQDVTVVLNYGAKVVLNVSPEKGTSTQEFTFDASQTTHDQFKTSYLEYRWDINGNEKTDKTWNKTNKIKYKYPQNTLGKKIITVEARDPTGYITRASQTIEITNNTPPQIRVFVIPNKEGTFENTYTIDASSSFDNETTFKCRIDSNYTSKSDIIYDSDFTNTCTWNKKFSKAGPHNLHVEVQDKDGKRSSEIITITISDNSSYISFLKQKRIMQGYSYKLYKVKYPNGGINVVTDKDLKASLKILKIYQINNEMAPEQTATRAEVIKMALTAFNIKLLPVYTKDYVFADVKNEWYARYIINAYKQGIIQGYSVDNKLYAKPNDQITRAEAIAIILRTAKFTLLENGRIHFTDVPRYSWAYPYIDTAYTNAFAEAQNQKIFGANMNITRGETASILYKVMNDK